MAKKDCGRDGKAEGEVPGGSQGRIDPCQESGKDIEQMETFGRYGFNKSHSAAYALVAYQTAYLRRIIPLNSWRPC